MRERLLVNTTKHEDNCVRRVRIFSGLTTQQQDIVATMARPESLGDGELVHGPGQRTGKMFVVHSGQIKVSRVLPSGRKQLLRVVRPGETLGEHAFLTGEPTLEEAEALEETRLCVFVHEDLAELIQRYPAIANRMLGTLGERLSQTEHQLTLNAQSLEVRIADYLLQQPLLRDNASAATLRVRLPLNKKDIASLLGTTPESFSRGLARLQRKNLLGIADDIVTLRDPAGLEALVVVDA